MGGKGLLNSVLIGVSTPNSPSKIFLISFLNLLTQFTSCEDHTSASISNITPGKAPYFHPILIFHLCVLLSISFPLDSSSKVQLDYSVCLECVFGGSR